MSEPNVRFTERNLFLSSHKSQRNMSMKCITVEWILDFNRGCGAEAKGAMMEELPKINVCSCDPEYYSLYGTLIFPEPSNPL